ncbi:MAG TPA: polysaccharide lyase family 7 protein [Actinospica sp.]|nr:polysaccharide lyase family 7 protein [Actinospica sp.]
MSPTRTHSAPARPGGRRLVLGAVFTALIGGIGVLADGALFPAAATAPAAAAKATVPLSGWNLTLPVDSAGCQCGDAEQLSPAAVISPWLTRTSGGGLDFWAPTKGATTPNSAHPRTELVSTSSFAGGGSATHTLTATLSVQQLPPADDIVVGQIHGGGSSSSIPLLLLHYTSGGLTVWVRPTPSTGSEKVATLTTGVPINGSFSYTISETGSKMKVSTTYAGATKSTTITLGSGFDGMTLRFQAGDYQQSDANGSTTEGGRVTFTALTQS